jgi:hypothetical protein
VTASQLAAGRDPLPSVGRRPTSQITTASVQAAAVPSAATRSAHGHSIGALQGAPAHRWLANAEADHGRAIRRRRAVRIISARKRRPRRKLLGTQSTVDELFCRRARGANGRSWAFPLTAEVVLLLPNARRRSDGRHGSSLSQGARQTGPPSRSRFNAGAAGVPVDAPSLRHLTGRVLRDTRCRHRRAKAPYRGGVSATGSLPYAASAWRGGQPALGVV